MASSVCHFFSFLLPSSSSSAKPPPPPAPGTGPPGLLQFQCPTALLSDGGSSEICLSSSSSTSWMSSASVVCPSLAYANTLYCKSAGYNAQILVDENESEESLLNRFRREVMKAGVIQECKRRRFFENKQDKRKRKSREAAKRNSRRRRPQSRDSSTQGKQEIAAGKPGKDHDDDQDNWELPPQGELPY